MVKSTFEIVMIKMLIKNRYFKKFGCLDPHKTGKFSNKMQIGNQHDQEADNDLIFQKFSFWPQSTSIRTFFEVITNKSPLSWADDKKLLVQFDLLK